MSPTPHETEPAADQPGSDDDRSDQPVRLPWSAPVLSVYAIDEVTQGNRVFTRLDGGSFFS